MAPKVLLLLIIIAVLWEGCLSNTVPGRNKKLHRPSGPKAKHRPDREVGAHIAVKRGAGSCYSYEFECLVDGICIDADWKCDGWPDCPDSSDEDNCGPCNSGQFDCGNQCINADWKCDGWPDCFNSNDEMNCDCEGGFSCGTDDLCIYNDWKCDGEDDCLKDPSPDEEGCTVAFLCSDGERTIPADEECDGVVNCGDYSDEGSQCGYTGFRCDDGFVLKSDESECDDVADCKDGSDENNCAFLCSDGVTIPADEECDGVVNCGDYSDEGSQCGYTGFRCDDGFVLKSDDSECDDVPDCKDGSDENNCNPPETAQNPPQSPSQPGEDSAVCGRGKRVFQAFIINGQDTEIEDWPWQVMLLAQSNSNHERYYFKCGGTLISPTHVLTAAHCVDGNSAFRVVLGSTRFPYTDDAEATVIDVKTVTIHQGFSDVTFDNDIALLTLNEPAMVTASEEELAQSRINTACLGDGTQTWHSTSKCFITGYGVIHENKTDQEEVLQEAQVVYQDRATCPYPTNYLTDNMICGESHGSGPRVDTCQGDSGGPMVCHKDFKFYLVGVTSWGIGCGQVDKPGVYTKVGNYLSWIKNAMSP